MKANFITFVRGLKNGTPPRFQSYLKSLTLLLAMVASVNAWGADPVLTLNNLGTSLPTDAGNGTITVSNYTLNYTNCKKQGDALLLVKGSSGGTSFFSNKTAMPGDIVSVKLYTPSGSSGSATYRCAFSTTECTTRYTDSQTAESISANSSKTYTCSKTGAKYFCVTIGNNNHGQIIKIDITYKAAAADPYTVTFNAGSHGSLECPSCTDGNKLTEASAGAGITLPGCTANTGYKFLGWATTSGATTADAGEADATYKPSKDITLYAVYIQQFDVKWYVNGDLKKTDTYDKGANLALPQGVSPTSSDCDNYKVFVGWRENTLDQPTDTKPTGIFTAASGTVTAPATYHAVFALKDGEDDEYVRETNPANLKDGMSIVIIDDYNNKLLQYSSGFKASTAPSEDENHKIKVTVTTDTWTLHDQTGGNWKIMNGTNYLGASGKPTSSSNSKDLSSTSQTTWTIANSTASGKTDCMYFRYKGESAALEYNSSSSKWVAYYNTKYASSTYFTERVYIPTVSYSQYSTSCVAASVEKPTITTTATKEQDVYWGTVPVTLTCETSGAEIYYTTDGNEPTKAGTKYTGLFNITATTTIKAKAFVGSDESYIATQTFTVGRTYADANAYLADKTNIADGEKVKITNLRVAITSFSGNRNDVYFAENTNFHVGSAAPNTWVVNGILTAEDKIFTAKVFSGPSYQLRPSSWGDLTYVTLSSITVKTAETTYTDGDKFNPTGLVITKTYSDNTTEDFAYEGNEGAFSFSPSLTTVLRPTNTSVTITVQGKSCNLDITVNPILVTGVTLDKTSAALFVGQTLQLNATVAPDNATTKTVSWSSSSNAATVSNSGLVTAAEAGSATITVTTTDQSKTATCAVNAYSVTINKVGDESKASNIATFNPANSQVVIGKATHFQFVSINVEGATCTGSASPYTLSNPTDNVVVTVTWKEDSKVTVTFSDAIHDNNSNYMEYIGDPIEFPTINDETRQAPTGDCVADHYHFVGWTKDASNPNDLVTPASETAPATDITYHAVWAKEL